MDKASLEFTLSQNPLAPVKEHEITVLLVDDQQIIADAVKSMVAEEEDIAFYYCSDPTKALEMASEVQPTVILQDLVMPQVDGLTLVKYFRAHPTTADVPLIVLSTKEEAKIKAEAFALGANDYMVKLPERLELLARIRYHSRGYIHLLERNDAYKRLSESQKVLQEELNQAANYVISLLPPPLTERVQTDWHFVPSTQLGGDSFGYHWLDDDHFAIYLLDVCGHGVGAALLSISAINVLRSQTLRHTDFHDPSSVLAALNETFPMEQQNNMFFTMWYGVYNKKNHTLRYASGGHPPAILVTGDSPETAEVKELKTPGLVIGGMPDMTFAAEECSIGKWNCLYVFSDGVFEIDKPDGTMQRIEEFVDTLVASARSGSGMAEQIFSLAKEMKGEGPLDDDFSLVRIIF